MEGSLKKEISLADLIIEEQTTNEGTSANTVTVEVADTPEIKVVETNEELKDILNVTLQDTLELNEIERYELECEIFGDEKDDVSQGSKPEEGKFLYTLFGPKLTFKCL